MIKLFKRKPSMASIAKTIEKIHNEFDSASEKLLSEAKAIIAGSDVLKGNRLKSLGFVQAAPVGASKEAEEKRRLADKIEYYQIWYPNYKFITEEMVEAICKKYGLLFGEASRYIGDIPEKNISEMEAFKLRDEDKETRTNIDDYYDQYRYHQMRQFSGLGGISTSRIGYSSAPTEKKTYYFKKPFKICAPVKDFDTKHMEVRDGYKLEYDPIVLQPVHMGYLIITKWGIEGDDASLVNEIKN